MLFPHAPIRVGVQERSAGGRPRADRVLWFSSVIKVWSHNRAAGDYAATRMLVSHLMVELHDGDGGAHTKLDGWFSSYPILSGRKEHALLHASLSPLLPLPPKCFCASARSFGAHASLRLLTRPHYAFLCLYRSFYMILLALTQGRDDCTALRRLPFPSSLSTCELQLLEVRFAIAHAKPILIHNLHL